jgi:hypothetical protein
VLSIVVDAQAGEVVPGVHCPVYGCCGHGAYVYGLGPSNPPATTQKRMTSPTSALVLR